MGARKGGAWRSPTLLASALWLAAPVGLPRALTDATVASSTPLSPVGGVPSPPAGSVAAGALPSTTPIRLSVLLRSADPKGLEATALAVSTPGSAQYRKYLTPAEVEQRFGPSPGAIAGVDAYLSRHGFAIGPSLGDGLIVTATGTAGTVRGALHTGLTTYRQRSGRVTYLNTSPPQMPSAVAPGIQSIVGLDDSVQLHPQLSSLRSQSSGPGSPARTVSTTTTTSGGARPCGAASSTASSMGAYTADQLASAYGFNSAYQAGEFGKGITVGVFELAGFARGDLKQFETCYKIGPKLVRKKVDGGTSINSGTIEAELDIEGIASMAPKARILDYEAPNSLSGVIDAYGAMESDDLAQVVSTSWGVCEAQAGSLAFQENAIFQGMAAQGQSIVAAAGDTGSEDCYATGGSTARAVDDPGSQPFLTAVGGTDLTAAGPPPVETVWNDGSGAGGGGVSGLWSMPSWQFGPGVVNEFSSGSPCHVASGFCREVPDVSASADPANGYVMFCSVSRLCKTAGGGWFAIGGSSAAAPLWAALLAVADQGLGSPVGFVNPALYAIAATGSTRDAFNDVTAGDNDFTGTNGGRYPATGGFDLASGWGSPNGSRLIPLLR